MNLNRQRGITQLVVVAVMAFLAIGLPITTKLVQQNQENRSQAALIIDAGGSTAVKCKIGSSFYRVNFTFCNWNSTPNALWKCKSNGTWDKKPCPGGCPSGTTDCKQGPTIVCTKNTGKKCENGKLYTCNSDGSAWKTPINCTTGACKNATECSVINTVGQNCATTYKNCTASGVAYYCSRGKIAKNDCAAKNQKCKNGACVASVTKCKLSNSYYSIDFNFCNTNVTPNQLWTCKSDGTWDKKPCPGGCPTGTSDCKLTLALKTCSYGGSTYAIGKAICQDKVPAECQSNGTWKRFSPCSYGCSGNGVCNPVPTLQTCTDYNYSNSWSGCINGIDTRHYNGYLPASCTGKPTKLVETRQCCQTYDYRCNGKKLEWCNYPIDPIWVLAEDCGTNKTCDVASKSCIDKKVTDITVSPQSKTINPGQSFTITAKVIPDNATNKSLKWESNNAFVAIVSGNGIVTAKESGKATVTVSSVEDSSIKKTVEVIVGQAASDETISDVIKIIKYSLSLKPTSLTLGVDKSALVQPILTPKRTTEVLTWKSDDNSIARVYIPYCSGNYFSRCVGSNFYLDGTVKKCTKCAGIRQVKIVGLKKGTAIITVTASPSGAKETIKVIVK